MNSFHTALAKKIVLALLFNLVIASLSLAQNVRTYNDSQGWKLLVDGESHFVKGVVWGYTPIGENYAYNLWSKPESYIKDVLDYECRLMKKAGVNTVRSFFNTPPRWVRYMYEQYGIMTIVNHTMGRYGYQVNGVWRPTTDYSDPETRVVLKRDILEVVEKFKNTPGVLMFALGNENNYGLEWKSAEIENLPEGERYREKAKYLYSLYNEIIAAAKKVDTSHPYAIVNGDIQYIDLIKEYCTDLDILGINAYRGPSFVNAASDLWASVQTKLNLPVVFMEFGSDAFNARTYEEDQQAQADILYAQWREIYRKSYGHGDEGNAIGGCVFEWRDEWWKYELDEYLFEHNTNASWANGGYTFDFVPGQNNMNEEWYGIMQLGLPNENDVSEAYPRMAYDLLKEIWKIDPYSAKTSQMVSSLDTINIQKLTLQSDVRQLKQKQAKDDMLSLTGGSFKAEYTVGGRDNEIEEDGKDGLYFTNTEMIFLDFGFKPSSRLRGDFTLNFLGNVSQKELEIFYTRSREDNSVEIYDFDATLELDNFDLNAFYHTERYHWQHEGDFYGLLWEATDIEGIDIWDDKAPVGVEFVGKGKFDGLKVVLGPEVYWGANPKIIAKYSFGEGDLQYTLMHSEDFSRQSQSESSSPTDIVEKTSRATTAYVKSTNIPGVTIELGAITSSSEKVDDIYDYVDDNGNIMTDEIEFEDTLGARTKVTVEAFDFGSFYGAATYAGLVADGGEPEKERDATYTLLPYSQYGNKIVFEGGLDLIIGNFTISPRALYRENLEDANPNIPATITPPNLSPGINARNREDDPFAVLDNREATSGEIFITYDPTPATDFYHWDFENREDAGFAFNLGFNYTDFSTPTDSYLFYFEEGDFNAAFGEGLESEEVWKGISTMIFNPDYGIHLVNRLEAGFQQSTGVPNTPTRKYYSYEFDFDFGKKHNLSGYVKKDQWGPYDFYRQFNVTYPWQFNLDYLRKIDHLLEKVTDERIGKTAGIGIKGIYRTLDENSPADEYQGGLNEYLFEVTAYMTLEF